MPPEAGEGPEPVRGQRGEGSGGIITPSLCAPAALLGRMTGENGGQKVCWKYDEAA